MSDPARIIEHMDPQTLLDFESHHPHPTPTKHALIRDTFKVSETRYYTLLLRAANSTEGVRVDPVTARFVRERAARQAQKREARVA